MHRIAIFNTSNTFTVVPYKRFEIDARTFKPTKVENSNKIFHKFAFIFYLINN